MIGGQDEDSCGKSATGENAGAEATRRLTARPRKAKSGMEITSVVTSDPYELLAPICSSLDGMDLATSQSHISFGLLPALSK
ncbi:hypothetical protein [Priestia megaterium]|uniref:hypothetical protein n=1 Tax=Priestia megaterium TaxID=1404 RepID=UPI001E430D56|nr:hypothetical protein [Priestia megaterium]MDR7245674.1 hypothetical protein [Priestia megaterium]